MSWGFRKSFKIAPGLKINLNKRSASLRVGPKNAGVTIGAKGAHASASLPGTGLSVRTKVGGAKAGRAAGHEEPAAAGRLVEASPPASGSAFGRFLYRLSAVIFGITAVLVVIGLLVD